MPIYDYSGIEGFAVDAKNAQDVYEAIDRMHTQLLDEIENREIFIQQNPAHMETFPGRKALIEAKIEHLKATQRILETAMESLLDMEGVKA